MLSTLRSLQQIWTAMRTRKGRRRVVFYSHGRQDSPHVWPLAGALAGMVDAQILYVCTGDDDPYIGHQAVPAGIDRLVLDSEVVCAAYLATIEADLCVSTLPDLGARAWQRSARVGHHVFVPHSLVSCHMIYRPGAFDLFDEVFCAGPHHVAEIRALEAHRNLRRKQLFDFGYPRLDSLLGKAITCPGGAARRHNILIAPSWGAPGLLEMHGEGMIRNLAHAGYRVVVRPHPETAKRSPRALEDLRRCFASDAQVTFDLATDSTPVFAAADLMISDWSGAALEYSLGLERPVLFVDIPRKVNNPDYESLGIEPVEVWARGRMGDVIATGELETMVDRIGGLLAGSKSGSRIAGLHSLRRELVFNVGTSVQAGASRLAEWLNDRGRAGS